MSKIQLIHMIGEAVTIIAVCVYFRSRLKIHDSKIEAILDVLDQQAEEILALQRQVNRSGRTSHPNTTATKRRKTCTVSQF